MTCRIVEEYGDERAAEAATEAKNEVVEGLLHEQPVRLVACRPRGSERARRLCGALVRAL